MPYLPKPFEREGRVRLTKREQKAQLDRKVQEQGGRCHYCNRVMNRISGDMRCATRDHVIPQPAGCFKDDRDFNIVAACWDCNNRKGSKRETA